MAVAKKIKHEIDVKRFAVAAGCTLALALFSLAAFTTLYNIGAGFVQVLATVFQGYGPTPVGAGIGVIWGMIDGIIGGALFAWVYNNASV